METPTRLMSRLWVWTLRLWDRPMQAAAPDTPPTVWFPQDGFVEVPARDPFRAPPSAETRWAMTHCLGHGGAASVRYCEDASCVASRPEAA
jgi:hypothetical protein